MLMTCRGLQELNVALGGSLKLEPNDQPEAKKHGTPMSARNDDERYRIRQGIELVPGGMLAKILKAERARPSDGSDCGGWIASLILQSSFLKPL